MINFHLNFYSIPPLFSSLLFFFLTVFIIIKRESKNSLTWVFAANCFVTFLWQFSWFLLFNSKSLELANLLIKIGYTAITFIPITFFHFFVNFLDLKEIKPFLKYHYLLVASLLLILWTTNLYIDGYYTYSWGAYPKAGVLHPVFLVYLILTDLSCIFFLYKRGRSIQWSGNYGNNIKYLLLGLIVFSFAAVDFLSNYGVSLYPLGFLFICVYLLIAATAIVRYRFMEIKMAVTRVGIFIFVYALVLGIPIWIGFKFLGSGLWLFPATLMGFFATVGPFLYIYIQKRAENALLQEQRRYQTTLRQASAGMGRIKDLRKLLNLIVYVVTRAIKLEHALVYIFDESNDVYRLGAFKYRKEKEHLLKTIPKDSPLITYLIQNSEPIIHEEIRQRIQDFSDSSLMAVEKVVLELNGALVFPILIEKRLLSLIVLGKKDSGKFYTEDDLSVFSILANQAALAIENAQFYEDMKKTQEQLFQAEKMATIGTMADGLSHQINNRFHALGFIAGDALDTIKLNKNAEMSDKQREVMVDLEKAFTRVQENVIQGGEVVQGLLRYTRKGDAGFTAVNFDQAFKSAFEMAQFKIKTQELKIIKLYDESVPKLKGNFTQLQEVFFNLIDNAYDAMMQRKAEKKEPDFQPTLKIHFAVSNDEAIITFEDNGIGVKDEDSHKLFTPFFTTKLSSKKGTGLGLYVIKKIIEDNHKGRVEMLSKYMVGTQMRLHLPIAID